MKKVKKNLDQLSKTIQPVDKKSLMSINGGTAAGDPPPFGVVRR